MQALVHCICFSTIVGNHVLTSMNDQELFWSGDFGNEYTSRNSRDGQAQANLFFWTKLLSRTGKLRSVLEFGCNRGLNLDAIKTLSPSTLTTGIEINSKAAQIASSNHNVLNQSLSNSFPPSLSAELAFTSGVLIHINPDMLPVIYDKLYSSSLKYILIKEYFSTQPQEINYRGHDSRLWKRDFAAEFMYGRPLRLVDYGFCWRHDPVASQDDLNWFLFEKLS